MHRQETRESAAHEPGRLAAVALYLKIKMRHLYIHIQKTSENWRVIRIWRPRVNIDHIPAKSPFYYENPGSLPLWTKAGGSWCLDTWP